MIPRPGFALLIVMCACLLSGCGLPELGERTPSQALQSAQTLDTRLGRGLQEQVQAHPGLTGVIPLADAVDAFSVRMSLVEAAQRSLDVQYYIWRDDITGNMLLRALHQAAERGVRVRLLLDDNGIAGLDPALALLDVHPNIQVRLFNPFPWRTLKPLGFLVDFGRLNRRMHNKSLTADGQVTVTGGRNIGDEYFGAARGVLFADLDILAAGAVVDEVSADFDRYWSSASAYPLDRLVSSPDQKQREALLASWRSRAATPQAQAYVQAAERAGFVQRLSHGQLDWLWTRTRMASDDPAKVLGQAQPGATLLAQLTDILGRPASSVDLVSPYFVPTERGVEAFSAMAQAGIRVRILTNALEATDVMAVHAGYAKRRKALLQAGIQLYEMRRQTGGTWVRERAGPFGSSGSSLHAKTFAVDGKRIFVGSFNFDPRSARLNTELGLVIESPQMADSIATTFDRDLPSAAYQVKLDPQGQLYWVSQTDAGLQRLHHEPGAGVGQRLMLWLLAHLPVEGLL